MIAVALELYGSLCGILGSRCVQLEMPDGSTVDEAIDRLLARSGPAAESLLRRPDGSRAVTVHVNGRPVSATDPALQSGDVISLLYPISGG